MGTGLRMWPPPPEVIVDYHRQQRASMRDDGQPFDQYLECSEGCGYLIGCGDAVGEIAHVSCVERTTTASP